MSARRAGDTLILVLAMPLLFLGLCAFDVVSRVALRFAGEQAFYRVVAACCRAFLASTRGVFRMRVVVDGSLPEEIGRVPFVVVANHQPPVDVPMIPCLFLENAPACVSRAGLGRGVPWFSHYMRATGSVLLRRGDPAANTAAIRELAARIEAKRRGVAIFPEGYTSWGTIGAPRPFRRTGLKTVLESAPSAIVIPIVFHHSERFITSRFSIPRFGVTLRVRILPPILRCASDADAVVDQCERILRAALPASAPLPPVPSLAAGETSWT